MGLSAGLARIGERSRCQSGSSTNRTRPFLKAGTYTDSAAERHNDARRLLAVGNRSYEAARRAFDWAAVLQELDWERPGHINLGRTIVDRHADTRGAALYWVGKDRTNATLTYGELRSLSNKIANLFRSLGVRK